MQSATSFFNRSLFRGNLRRTWPLWFAYTLVWLMVLPLPLLIELADEFGFVSADVAQYFLFHGAVGGVVMAVVCGIFFAMALFAYLTNTRATQGFHAMPVRRETLYVTNYLTGLFCLLSSMLLAFALAELTAAVYGVPELAALGQGLLAAIFSVLFFYSFAVFCMMFTGQILAAPVFYGILNILAAGMEALVRAFAGNFLFGYSENYNEIFFGFLSPVYKIATTVDVSRVREQQLVDGVMVGVPTDQWELQGLSLLAVYAAVGIVFAVLGLLVYRRRASEATGSTVAIPWARPLFKYGVSLCAAFSFGQLIYYLFFGVNLARGEYSLAGTLVCMLFAGLLGYFAAEMLLQKSFRVWRSGRAGALVFSAVLVCFGFAMSLDLTGYEGYVPDLDEVQSVRINLNTYGVSIYETLSEPESIALAADAHRALVADKARQLRHTDTPSDPENGTSYLSFRIYYYLEDGSVVERRYYSGTVFADELHDPDSLTCKLTALANCPEVLRLQTLGEFDSETCTVTGGCAYLYYYDEEKYLSVRDREDSAELTAEQAQRLYDAVERDFRAGHIAANDLFFARRDTVGYTVHIEMWYTKPIRTPQVVTETTTMVVTYEGSASARPVDHGNYGFDIEILPTMTYAIEELNRMDLFDGVLLFTHA